MSRRLDELTGNASAVGRAGLTLARAEFAALSEDLKLSGRSLGRIAALVLVCLFLLFWALAVLIYASIEIGSLWLPRWASALVVLGILLLLIAGIGSVAWRRFSRLDSPAATVRKRIDEHREWWNRRVADRER